jgi:hypothetical protein
MIDELLREFNIVIYNTAPPFVDPTSKDHKIMFGYTVKKCFPGQANGWNHRIIIGKTKWHDDDYVAKREALIIAATYTIVHFTCNPRH